MSGWAWLQGSNRSGGFSARFVRYKKRYKDYMILQGPKRKIVKPSSTSRSDARKVDRATGSFGRRGLRRPGTATSSIRWEKRESRGWGTRRRAYHGWTGAVAACRRQTRATGSGARWRRRSGGLLGTGNGGGGAAWRGDPRGDACLSGRMMEAVNRRRPA
jgi:hypothetical protein